MKFRVKKIGNKIANRFGYKLVSKDSGWFRDWAVELTAVERDFIKYIRKGQSVRLSMVSDQRLVATLKSCRYVVENDIAGDFVECGVWRGGNSILAKKVFEYLGSDKKVFMFDTFTGMTEPSERDTHLVTNQKATQLYEERRKDTHTDWVFSPISDVRSYCEEAGIDMDGVIFVQGDVLETLDDPNNIPDAISVLRLDTDWYASTKKELEVLYPRIPNSGVLLIDDYGTWGGSRQAVDEYFSAQQRKPLLSVSDYAGRIAIKI